MPAEGEAAPAAESESTGGLYDLASVPEDLRPHVEPHLKAIEGNVTKKLQEYSEKLKSYEPYEELGISEMDPQALQQLLAFAELAQDENQFAEWWKQTGESLGLFPEADEDDLDEEDLTPDSIKQMIAEEIASNMRPVTETLQQQEAQRREAAIEANIDTQLAALKEQHGDDFDTDAVVQLSYAYLEDGLSPEEVISKGVEDYQRLIGKGEAGLFAKKTQQPSPAEGPGVASNAPNKITDFDNAGAAALERLKANSAAA